MNDITARKQAEEAQRQSQALLKAIFDNTPIGINLLQPPDNRAVMLNHAFLDIIGYTRDESLGHTAEELNLLVDQSAGSQMLVALQASQVVRNWETVLRHKSGETRPVLVSVEKLD